MEKDIVRLVTIYEDSIPSLNLMRLDFIEKLEYLEDVMEISKKHGQRTQEEAKKNYDSFYKLYKELFFFDK